jgi:hypothetical protein
MIGGGGSITDVSLSAIQIGQEGVGMITTPIGLEKSRQWLSRVQSFQVQQIAGEEVQV